MRSLFSALLLTGVLLTAPAYADPREPVPANSQSVRFEGGLSDPIEPFNRAIFQFNRAVDFLILKPVTSVYTFILPQFVQDSITAFLTNLGTPIVMLNTALQGDWQGFETSLHRLAVNSTLGMAGFIDVASHHGLQPVRADFGQTLGKWGLGHGFYVVLPVIGSSSLRDASGRAVDGFVDPYNYAFWKSETDWPIYARAGLTAIDTRARFGGEYEQIMRTAVDPYVTFRSIYAQRRAYMVQDRSVDAYGAVEAD